MLMMSCFFFRHSRWLYIRQQSSSFVNSESEREENLIRVLLLPPIALFIFVLRKKGSKTKERMKEEEIEKGDCGPPTRKVFFWFCRTWTKRYLITSQTRVKRVSRIHHRTILMVRMVRWCIRLTRLTLVCEVIRYRLVQVRQNQKKKKKKKNRFIDHHVSEFVFNWRLPGRRRTLLLNFYFFVQHCHDCSVFSRSAGRSRGRHQEKPEEPSISAAEVRGFICVDSHATRSVVDEARRDREVLVSVGMHGFVCCFFQDGFFYQLFDVI